MDDNRVVTANLPGSLFNRLDAAASRIERTKSWIIKQALDQWLAEDERRYALTLEALEEVDRGESIPHEDVVEFFREKKQRREQA